MAGSNRIPRTAHLHYDEAKKQFRVKATAVDEQTNNNQVREFIEWFNTLSEAVNFILLILAGVSPTYHMDPALVGDWKVVATTVNNSLVNSVAAP